MFGWTGTILRIDLAKGVVTRETTDPKIARDYLGARGLGGYIIRSEVDPATDPLGPDNKIVFSPGP
ncbi:MAG TPA: aldehyde ferredoxin oxidoreductase N-terminal domain-containing protein, partial [Thermoleophilia bacterium]|nr:aldehyde ferredoxin oxidoreductase N-terminal domain-containing protein [Thermoleophilia bacterium]